MRELSLHILDLVQNSAEAGADCISLAVIEDKTSDLLTIRVTDNGRGMDAQTAKQVIDPFYTSRKTRKVGLGLPLIDMSTEQCDGQLLIKSAVGQGTVVEASWRLSHLDRPPLGDLPSTLKSLIIGNSDIDIRYSHMVDDNEFCLSTRELKTILDGIPFTHPDVLQWLDDYVCSHERQLYGGVLDENS